MGIKEPCAFMSDNSQSVSHSPFLFPSLTQELSACLLTILPGEHLGLCWPQLWPGPELHSRQRVTKAFHLRQQLPAGGRPQSRIPGVRGWRLPEVLAKAEEKPPVSGTWRRLPSEEQQSRARGRRSRALSPRSLSLTDSTWEPFFLCLHFLRLPAELLAELGHT